MVVSHSLTEAITMGCLLMKANDSKTVLFSIHQKNYGNIKCLAGPEGHNICSVSGFKPLTPRACIHAMMTTEGIPGILIRLQVARSQIGNLLRCLLPQRSAIRSNLLVAGSLLRRMCGYYRPLFLIY